MTDALNDSPIRTLHVNTEPTWRGGERQTLLLTTGLAARGHVAEIICPPGAPLGDRARAEGLTVHDLKMRGELDLVAVGRLRRIFDERDADIVQMHTSHAHTLCTLARMGRSRPATVVARRVDYSIHRSGTWGFTHVKYRYGVDRYIAISAAIGEQLVKDGVRRERVRVVHSGVIPLAPPERDRAAVRAEFGIPADARVVGNVAHMALHKGQIHLVRAIAELAPRYDDLHLLLVGDGEERERLESAAEKLGLSDRVHLAGFRSNVAEFLDAFDMFIMPSLHEGLCTSLLDALSRDVPIIGSRVGGIPEIIEEGVTGLLAPVGDEPALAAAIARFLDEPELARRTARAGHEKADRHFSADAMVDGTVEVYRELLERTATTGSAP